MKPLLPVHGGTDGGPTPAFDFSTNASPCGPPPALMQAVLDADRRAYPDPHYRALRSQLSHHLGHHHDHHHDHHHVDPDLILPAAGGAEAIRRLTLAASLSGHREVWVPRPGFGDYALAAQALGLAVRGYAKPTDIQPDAAALVWICEPCNPTGASVERWPSLAGHVVVVDQAYEPLRLSGTAPAPPPGAWRLVCPNKALGLCGVRAAYLVAPATDKVWAHALSLAPSWVLSAEGAALLMHWPHADTLAWLARARAQLCDWTASQRALLGELGWLQGPSCTPFWLARPPQPDTAANLRACGIQLRDATSFGLPGWVRISAQAPAAQQALAQAVRQLQGELS